MINIVYKMQEKKITKLRANLLYVQSSDTVIFVQQEVIHPLIILHSSLARIISASESC